MPDVPLIVVQHIPSGVDLDPITVFWEQFGPSKGQVTIACYGSAWTAYWGGMGDDTTIYQFFREAGTDYLVGKLMDSQWQQHSKRHEKYLVRIVDAIKRASAPTEANNTKEPE